ncbi:MAG: ABC transporter ATP-binding protein, partial [Acidobacteria bacterium]|nr:ABC transporter ATP-binding protein [Acidobacteriota bacterium]
RARVDELLDRVGIGGERRMPLRKFSKGMLQRVGLAQALLNQPDLVFLDEPMSGLDPLGRRDVRALILELRDRGCTVVFSSHILSDAEALCSRVGIIVAGQLVTAGRLSEILAFQVTGWEIVMTEVDPQALTSFGDRIRRVTRISDGRYAIEVPADTEPDRMLADLRTTGSRFISMNPIRTTLEDYFVQQVAARQAQPPAGRFMPEG